MKMSIIFSETEVSCPDFESDLELLNWTIRKWLDISFVKKANIKIYKGVSDEAQKEKACDKGFREQRRNKTVNASKSS